MENRTLVPNLAQIELTQRCNTNCLMCGSYKLNIVKEDMSFDDFKTILDQFKNPLDDLSLTGSGEPLLYQQFPEVVSYCTEKGISKTVINTNGLLLDKSLAKKLASARLGKVLLSFHGGSKDVYEHIMPNARFNDTLEKVSFLKGIAETKVYFKAVASRYNAESLPQIPRLVKEVGADGFICTGMIPIDSHHPYANPRNIFTALSKRRREYIEKSIIEECNRYKIDYINVLYCNFKNACNEPFQKVYIDIQGNVYICCRGTGNSQVLVGNVFNEGIERAWNSARMWKLRDKMKTGLVPQFCRHKCHLKENPDLLYNTAQKLIKENNPKKTKLFLLKTIKRDSNHYYAYYNLASLLEKEGDYESSLRHFDLAQKAMKATNSNKTNMNQERRTRNEERAFSDEMAVKGGICFHKGEIYYKLKKYEEAKKEFLRCMELYPQHQKACKYLKTNG
ncbi:MAG: radical SAM protein [bacterium]